MSQSSEHISQEILELLPAYEKIKILLSRQIESGELKPGDRLPSEFELCDTFKVSRTTVVRALTDLAGMGVIVRKHGRGSYVAERQQSARSTGSTTRTAIGILVRQMSTPFGMRVIEGLESVISELGYELIVYNSRRQEDREAELLAEISRNQVAGLIAIPLLSQSKMTNAYRDFLKSGKPLVLVDNEIEELECDIVTEDNVQGGYDLTAHLLDQGHEQIAFVPTRDQHAPTVKSRYLGYRRAHTAFGISIRDGLYAQGGCNPDMSFQEIAAILDPLFSDYSPSALVCGNDLSAVAVDAYLSGMGKNDVQIGFFDSRNPFRITRKGLVRMLQSPDQMGIEAARLLIRRLTNPDEQREAVRILLPQKLIEPSF